MIYPDQTGRKITISHPPLKIISTVPSQTELLIDLGLKDRMAGITKFCIHPREIVKAIPQIGGTKQLNIELIRSIKPDLIIANKEENEQEQIETLMAEFPVWISDIFNLDDSLQMIRSVGALTGTQVQTDAIIQKIAGNFQSLEPSTIPLKVLYLIWRKPYMIAGKDTFIDHMLGRCGLVNVAPENRYPEISAEQVKQARPDVILLSSEPYPFSHKHIEEFNELLPHVPVYLVDGEMFSWYGSRLVHAPAYFNRLIANITHDAYPEN